MVEIPFDKKEKNTLQVILYYRIQHQHSLEIHTVLMPVVSMESRMYAYKYEYLGIHKRIHRGFEFIVNAVFSSVQARNVK